VTLPEIFSTVAQSATLVPFWNLSKPTLIQLSTWITIRWSRPIMIRWSCRLLGENSTPFICDRPRKSAASVVSRFPDHPIPSRQSVHRSRSYKKLSVRVARRFFWLCVLLSSVLALSFLVRCLLLRLILLFLPSSFPLCFKCFAFLFWNLGNLPSEMSSSSGSDF